MPQAPQPTITVKVIERNANLGKTQKGAPKLGIKTQAGKWIQVTGGEVGKIEPGHELVISEPRQFGNQWFASLIRFAAEPQQVNGKDQAPVAQPVFNETHKKLSWKDFARTVGAAYQIAWEWEPDIDQSSARATVISAIIAALTKADRELEPPSEEEAKWKSITK